eukprot:6211981-Pleurochrysis_carterae.AAC.7
MRDMKVVDHKARKFRLLLTRASGVAGVSAVSRSSGQDMVDASTPSDPEIGVPRGKRPLMTRVNFRHSANVTFGFICHWESGDRMARLIQHSPSIH